MAHAPDSAMRRTSGDSALRVVLISRRFWPLVGGAERHMADVADALAAAGHRPTILTAHFDRHWPRRFTFRGATVFRLKHPQSRFWGTYRYMRSIGDWLRTHRQQIDVVYVSMLKHDAAAAVSALRESDSAAPRVPVILRAEGSGETGDVRWQQTATFGSRIKRRCLQADAFVAISDGVREEMLAAGYADDRIVRIDNGVNIPPQRSGERRQTERRTAREMLRELSHELMIPDEAPLAIYTGRLSAEKRLGDLVLAWKRVIRRRPDARLLLVGHGEQRGKLIDQIHHQGLRGRVILAGIFEEPDELLKAADLFVLPSAHEGMSLSLMEAMAAPLPVVASDIPANRAVVEHEITGLLFPRGNIDALTASIERVWDDNRLGRSLSQNARQQAEQRFDIRVAADRHVSLFRDLRARVTVG